MNRTFLLPPLSANDLLELQRLLRARNISAGFYRRCLLIWQLAAGCSIAEASQIANLHYTNAHKWVKRFQSAGLAGLEDRARPGRPRIYAGDIENRIIEISTSRPQDIRLGFTTWSLSKLERHVRQLPGLESVSRETMRRILGRHGLRFLTGRTWCESNDPEFEVKKTP